MPDCVISSKAGNTTRSIQVLNYLNDSNNNIDFLSLNDWSPWNQEAINAFNNLFPRTNLILVDRKINKKQYPLKSLFLYTIPNIIPKLLKGTSIDLSNYLLNKRVTKILNAKKYDVIIISYASWAKLIDKIKYNSYLILDSHDFITAQSRDRSKKIGKLFQSEINAINKFNEVWTFSIEEKYIYEQFTNKKIVHIPISFIQKEINTSSHYTYDILYVASNNPHNIRAINWFLSNVLPLLGNSVHIHIVGKIGEEIKEDFPNISIHGIVEDIQEFYNSTRVCICPMLSGTGVKIKVLESLSNNIPVVTNTRGIDGLAQKFENGCLVSDTPQEFAQNILKLIRDDDYYIKIRKQAYHFTKSYHNIENEIVFFYKTLK